ncbi:MAG TPA: 1,6-anhydro-N-acetylmuramyl-L-alanine amidase AmpD [Burkholderiales bacterium]|jgi:AmpD protein|nr:1,6-anhydro-N-acetylmuramyl-L-alanine amidase AmpD [Burkholderiales bacterium]
MRIVDSPNQDERPPGVEIGLVVVHAISLPPGQFGGDAIERLFTNRLDPSAHPYFESVAHLRVSSHFLVRRDGALVRFVPVERRAWHAGASTWRGRSRCNDFSVGIELEGADDAPFEDSQYAALALLLTDLRKKLPLRAIAGHDEIAPGRKTDPGPRFDWNRLLVELARPLAL